MAFWKLALFPFIGKEAFNLVDPLNCSIGHHRYSNLLRYASEKSKGSNRKMAIGKLKINYNAQ